MAKKCPADNTRARNGNTSPTVPYLWGLNPIVCRAAKLSGDPDYRTLFDSRYKGSVAESKVA
jgi:hypothetical protein